MRWGAAWLAGLMGLLAADASADDVALISPVQGSEGVRGAYEARVQRALERALNARGIAVAEGGDAGGRAVACGTPECAESVLDQAGASHAVVPAMWVRSGGRRELTLTLVGKSGRNVNAGTVLNGDLSSTIATLVDSLLAQRQRDFEAGESPGGAIAERQGGLTLEEPWPATQPSSRSDRPPGQAWVAGPVLLWIGGAATVAAAASVAAMRSDTESINGGALAGWLLLGGAAVAGGSAWWVVGRRRRQSDETRTAIHVSPRGFDLRVRF